MICRNCGGEYPDYKDNCPNCGTRNPNVSYNSQYSAPQNSGNRNGGQYGYQQPVNTVYVNEPDVHYDEHVSIGGWIGRWLVMCIPIVNIIMLFVWAFGGSRKYSLKTWARARLLLALIVIIALLITVIVLAVSGVNVQEVFKNAKYYR
ncbi:hypothetical protein [Ruminococcus sp. JL13D9]|jgi:hypothetical protein|uniref:hypothetical protein n=1 Tax=Ruminococcus sp. JL13D9 TaxID=3233381 RepID=UPI00389A5831